MGVAWDVISRMVGSCSIKLNGGSKRDTISVAMVFISDA